MQNIAAFFTEYASASMSGNAEKVAAFYAPHFMMATKDESKGFTNDAAFIEWLNGVFQFNKQTGMQTMKVKQVDVQPIGKHFAEASVTWSTTFAKKPDHAISFTIHYILNCAGEEPKIVLYISEEDQEALMKKEGLI